LQLTKVCVSGGFKRRITPLSFLENSQIVYYFFHEFILEKHFRAWNRIEYPEGSYRKVAVARYSSALAV
jgi:hypothetical protein